MTFLKEACILKEVILYAVSKDARGAAPIIKNGMRRHGMEITKIDGMRGEEPMAKNISVVDESGKVYGATYPKRAEGLVKKGRAHFRGETTICLVRPPYNMEDESMDMNYNRNDNNVKAESLQMLMACFTDILQRIEEIVKNTSYVEAAIQHVAELDVDNEDGMSTINSIVCNRETTNQKALEVLENLALTALGSRTKD